MEIMVEPLMANMEKMKTTLFLTTRFIMTCNYLTMVFLFMNLSPGPSICYNYYKLV